MMIECQKRQRIIRRNKDGEQEKFRCMDKTSENYREFVDADICKNCHMSKVPNFPSNSKLITNYGKAVKRWIVAGRPTRSKEEVKRIYDLCASCNWFDSESQRCKGCGCNVKPKGLAIFNKIKMLTEHCPRRLW